MKVGDDLIMTKYAGLEGTAIIASEYREELRGMLTGEDEDELKMIKESLSVVPVSYTHLTSTACKLYLCAWDFKRWEKDGKGSREEVQYLRTY